MTGPKKNDPKEELDWENPQNPEEPSDDREREQIVRQLKKRRGGKIT